MPENLCLVRDLSSVFWPRMGVSWDLVYYTKSSAAAHFLPLTPNSRVTQPHHLSPGRNLARVCLLSHLQQALGSSAVEHWK